MLLGCAEWQRQLYNLGTKVVGTKVLEHGEVQKTCQALVLSYLLDMTTYVHYIIRVQVLTFSKHPINKTRENVKYPCPGQLRQLKTNLCPDWLQELQGNPWSNQL